MLLTSTEVYMIHVSLGIITVNIEGMAIECAAIAHRCSSTVHQGTTSNQFSLHRGNPFFFGHEFGHGRIIIILEHVMSA